jgi:hypothetical protein
MLSESQKGMRLVAEQGREESPTNLPQMGN